MTEFPIGLRDVLECFTGSNESQNSCHFKIDLGNFVATVSGQHDNMAAPSSRTCFRNPASTKFLRGRVCQPIFIYEFVTYIYLHSFSIGYTLSPLLIL